MTRKREECENFHIEDNQGQCHNCGILLNRYLWELYAGEGTPHPDDKSHAE
jgi:hypothetical protein